MHIAIGFWGLLRALQFTISSIHEQILLPIQAEGHTYEIFLHTYSIQGVYQSTRNHEVGTVINASQWQLLHPHYVYVEDQALFDQHVHYELFQSQGDPWHNNFSSFQNHMRALNSLYHVTLAIEQASHYRHYDAVLFLRPDVEFLNSLPIRLLSHPSYHLPSMKTLFLPDFHRSCHSGEYNDRMALGGLAAGLTYGKKLESAYLYSLEHKLHAEKFTFHHLQLHHVDVHEIPFRFRRIRSNGETHIRDYEIISPSKQEHYQRKGIVYTGKVAPTPWYIRYFYSLLELLTFYQVYIWNHDDNGNLYCDPHGKITNNEVKKFYKEHPMSNKEHLQAKAQEAQTSLTHRMYCTYERSPLAGFEGSTGNKIAQILKPKHCKIVQQGQPDPFLVPSSSSQLVDPLNEGEENSVGMIRQRHRHNHSHPRMHPHGLDGEGSMAKKRPQQNGLVVSSSTSAAGEENGGSQQVKVRLRRGGGGGRKSSSGSSFT